jgi:hypothetical protein
MITFIAFNILFPVVLGYYINEIRELYHWLREDDANDY